MATAQETITFWRYITSSLHRLVACLDGLSEAELNWKPLPDSNSQYVLATHTLANTEENILGVVCGQPVTRQREAEFSASGDSAALIQQRWLELQTSIEKQFAAYSAMNLDEERQHPRRGTVTARDIFIVVARHAAEHLGQAELTRDLLFSKPA
jgi:hypothetical protein